MVADKFQISIFHINPPKVNLSQPPVSAKELCCFFPAFLSVFSTVRNLCPPTRTIFMFRLNVRRNLSSRASNVRLPAEARPYGGVQPPSLRHVREIPYARIDPPVLAQGTGSGSLLLGGVSTT